MSTAADWLAPVRDMLDTAYGPLDIPDTVTATLAPAMTAEWLTGWTLQLTATRWEQHGRKPPTVNSRTVRLKPILHPQYRNQFTRGRDAGDPDAQATIDALAAWAADGINTLDLGATS